MDDGSRCLLDVIDDPQLLQSFLENTNGAIERLEGQVVNQNIDNSSHKTLTVKQMEVNGTLPAITTLITDSKQVDQVTSSGGNNSPVLSLNKPTSGQLIIDEKQMINMVSSSVGLIPISALSSAQSISIAQPTLTTLTSTAPIGQTLRAPAPPWPPTSFQFAGPRNSTGPVTVQLPQQLIMSGGGMSLGAHGLQQLLLTAPRPGAPQVGPQLTGGIQPGQLVQIIQTPQGTQILPTNPSPALQPIVSTNTSTTTKSPSTPLTSRSNKQILPKPPGSGVSTTNAVTNNSANKCGQLGQQNTLKVINNLTQNVTQTSGSTAPTTQQILLGPNGQPAGVLSAGPQGTFILNPMLSGLGSQPILFQQNFNSTNVPNSVHLTLRPPSHTSPMVAMSNGLTAPTITATDHQNNGLLSALTAQTSNVAKQTPSQSPQPQTFVIPSNSTPVSSATAGVMMTSAGRPGSNIILTRPQMIGAPHQSPPTVPTGQQFLQIQTPNGPVLVAIPAQPQIMPQVSTVSTQPTHSFQLGNTMIPIGAQHLPANLNPGLQPGTHPALHALLTHTDASNGQTVLQTSMPSVATSNTVIFTSQPQIIATRPQLPPQSKPSVNLAELLKEHGILPESSPPSSPVNPSMTDTSGGAIHSELLQPTPPSQQTVLMVPNGPNQPHNLVLAPSGAVTPAAPPQLRLAIGPDGSVILQNIPSNAIQPQIQSQLISNSNNLKYSDPLKDSGLGSSQPSPDSTTPTIDSTTTSTTSTTTSTTTSSTATSVSGQNTSALLEQLNTGPAVKVPDIVASLALSSGSNTTSEESKPITSQTTLIPLTVQNINNSLEQQKQTILTIPVQTRDTTVPTVANGSSNAVIRIGSCDSIPTSLVFTTTPTTVFTSPPKTHTTDSLTAPTPASSASNSSPTAVIDQNGVPMIQVSPNNHEFLERLETQIKTLSALKSPTNQDTKLLQELLSLQQKMNQARQSLDGKPVQNSVSPISVSQQTQQLLLQSVQSQSQTAADSQQTPHNVHLVNLLKQTPVNQASSQLRLVTPTGQTSAPATATIQLGNQLITFTTPAKQQLQNLKSMTNQTQQTVLKQSTAPTSAVILRLHASTPTLTSTPATTATHVTTSTSTKTSIIKHDPHLDKERRVIKTLKAIQQQLNVDQNNALKPDTKRPFSSRDDACKRLLRYHVFNSPTMTTKDMDKSDHLFELISQHMLYKKQQLFDKFRVLLLKQSMKETPSSEHVMIDRMFLNEETIALKADKELVAEGKSLNLPPPPPSWYQMIRSSFEVEEQKHFINRKRKSSIGSDDEYNCQNSQIRRHEEPDASDDSEDEDDDSDDEDNEEKDETISNFLHSRSETEIANVGHYYDDIQHNLHVQNGSRIDGQSHVPLNSYVDPTQQHNELDMYSDMNGDATADDWTDSILNTTADTRIIPWNHRFGVPESEAAVAVESILNDDEEEQDMSVDLSGIEGLDDNLEDDNDDDDDDDDDDEDEDEDDDEEEVNSFGLSADYHQQDMKTQRAIESIMPSVGPHHNNSYTFHSHGSHPSLHPHLNDFRAMDYPHIPNIHDQRRSDAILRTFGGQHSTGVNDPILDEAVKSILS